MRRRDDAAERRCLPGYAALADEVCGDDRLPVAGRERMRHAPEKGGAKRRENDERAQMIATDQRRKTRVGDPVGRR